MVELSWISGRTLTCGLRKVIITVLDYADGHYESKLCLRSTQTAMQDSECLYNCHRGGSELKATSESIQEAKFADNVLYTT